MTVAPVDPRMWATKASGARRSLPILAWLAAYDRRLRDADVDFALADVRQPVVEMARRSGLLAGLGEDRVFLTIDEAVEALAPVEHVAALRPQDGRPPGRARRPRTSPERTINRRGPR